jgi:hypothetical protein
MRGPRSRRRRQSVERARRVSRRLARSMASTSCSLVIDGGLDAEALGQIVEMPLRGVGIHTAGGPPAWPGRRATLGGLVVRQTLVLLGLPVVSDPLEAVLEVVEGGTPGALAFAVLLLGGFQLPGEGALCLAFYSERCKVDGMSSRRSFSMINLRLPPWRNVPAARRFDRTAGQAAQPVPATSSLRAS